MFKDWSPAQLATALGYRIDLRNHGLSGRTAYIVVPNGRSHATGHSLACDTLSRLARIKGIDPRTPPVSPRALMDGQEQTQ